MRDIEQEIKLYEFFGEDIDIEIHVLPNGKGGRCINIGIIHEGMIAKEITLYKGNRGLYVSSTNFDEWEEKPDGSGAGPKTEQNFKILKTERNENG